MTIAEYLKLAIEQLGSSPTPRLDAEVLLMHSTGLSRAGLVTQADLILPDSVRTKFQNALSRRVQGEPIAYITGWREFWSLDLEITPGTLIPRPETELLVETALAVVPPGANWRLVDLGTGSGAVALAIAKERPTCHVMGIDRSAEAIDIASRNSARLGIGNVRFQEGDWNQLSVAERFHVLVSNPPYIAAGDPHLGEGDLRYEPRSALVSGKEGLDAIFSIARCAGRWLEPGGSLLVEHGYQQRESVNRILAAAGYLDIQCLTDLEGRDRVTICRSSA